MNFSEESHAFSYAASRCAVREYCCRDWYDKFVSGGLPAEAAERVVARLVEERFIDEARYARAYVHDKVLYDRWGRVKIRQSLRMKGLPDSVVSESFSAVTCEEYEEALRCVLEQKRRTLKARNDYEFRQKLARFAIGRGFEPALVFERVGEGD